MRRHQPGPPLDGAPGKAQGCHGLRPGAAAPAAVPIRRGRSAPTASSSQPWDSGDAAQGRFR